MKHGKSRYLVIKLCEKITDTRTLDRNNKRVKQLIEQDPFIFSAKILTDAFDLTSLVQAIDNVVEIGSDSV